MSRRSAFRAALVLALALPLAAAGKPREIAVPGTRVFPESVTATAAGDLIVGSAGSGALFRIRKGERTARVWIEAAAGGSASTYGVLADDRSGTLFACTNQPIEGDGPGSALRLFALADGKPRGVHPIAATGPAAVCNDIAVAPDGAAYVSETLGGRILRLAPGASTLETWYEDKALFGIDGIVFSGDGRTLYLTNVIANELYALDLDGSRPGRLRKLTPSIPLGRPDALRPAGGDRYLMTENEAGRVTEVRFVGDRAEMRPFAEGDPGVTGVAVAAGRVWSVNGHMEYTREPALKGKDPGPAAVRDLGRLR